MTKSKELLIQDLGEKSKFCYVLYDEGKPLKQWGFLVCKMGRYSLRGPPTKDCGLKSYVEVPMGEVGREELKPSAFIWNGFHKPSQEATASENIPN